jgi:hypothetical protein
MLRSFALQKNVQDFERFKPILPGKYLYFDRYLTNLTCQKKQFNLTINLFDGQVRVAISTTNKTISISGDKELSIEVMRHLYQIPSIRDFSIEVVR